MNELVLLCHYEAKDHTADQGSNEVDFGHDIEIH